ncbi:hypothetical protein ACMFMG_003560 [Clarireedia jacksonii]
MVEARKATFGGQWPHESKKGWKCKIKQLADAGWKYTPTLESDDMATCTYCSLALDGWEPSDKPLEEHFNRSPECAFFILVEEHKAAAKKPKARKARASKASRMSTQSVATVLDDDILQLEPTTRGRKTKARASAVSVNTTMMDEDQPEPPKRGRGTKARTSTLSVNNTTMLDEAISEPPKRGRATKARTSTLSVDNTAMLDEAIPEPPAKKGKAGKAGNSTVSADTTMTGDDQPILPPKKGRAAKVRNSTVSVNTSMVDEDHPEPPKRGRPAKSRNSAVSVNTTMMDEDQPEPPKRGKSAKSRNSAISVNTTMMDEDQPEPPKRGRPAKTRNSTVSVDTTMMDEDQPEPPKRGRPAKARSSTATVNKTTIIDEDTIISTSEEQPIASNADITAVQEDIIVPPKKGQSTASSTNTKSTRGRKRKSEELENDVEASDPAPKKAARGSASRLALKASVAPLRAPSPEERVPSLSPQSSQSSDAENHPPSSRPSLQKPSTPPAAIDVPLGSSPSKRNIIAGPQSTVPWEEIDIDTFFTGGADENDQERTFFSATLDKLKSGDLSSPEKKMTVEQWIYHNAEVAEQKLKEECERMVGLFEMQGMKALASLEAIQVVQ